MRNLSKRKDEGKEMGVFFSPSKKGPVSEHSTRCVSVTKFVLRPIDISCWPRLLPPIHFPDNICSYSGFL